MQQTIEEVKQGLDEQSRDPVPSKQDRVRISEEQGGRARWEASQPTGKVRLFDRIEGRWTSLLEPFQAQYDARKVVFACTAPECVETSVFDTGGHTIARHIKRVRESHETHRDAELIPGEGAVSKESGHRCTGCGFFFLLRKQQGRNHLARIKEQYSSHRNAGEVTMLRFSLGLDVPAPANGVGPVASQVDRSSAPRSRRRRRRRRG